ncbi:hypothetical protein HGRIS_013236 [Hohenbuehelia grisea]|uniref:CS domain-containing protein n=1 Tax=Hohenbuehelia grisea TaxID=104357 RepID=A0ABR3IV49_9AGAR
MITPRFSCSQTTNTVVVSIYCPSIRASDVEIHVDHTLFSIHVNPYFLRLNFSHPIIEDDESNAKYEPSSGYLTVTLTKADPGQDFQDLDLLAKLLAPRPTNVQAPCIEVVSSTTEEDELVEKAQNLSIDRQEILEAAQNDWQLPQSLPEDIPGVSIHAVQRYGFLNMYTGYFKHISHTENEVDELGPDAEIIAPAERRKKRIAHENSKWDEEHYMADFADDEMIQELIAWKHPYIEDNKAIHYTDEENMVMLRLPRKEYLATPHQTHVCYLTLLSLLFSYAYDSRTTQCDPTPESAWTIAALVPAFTALDPPPYDDTHIPFPLVFSPAELNAALVPSYRRCLAFPLYRSFALAEACRADVAGYLSKGKRLVLRCLLDIKNALDHHEVYYLYSKLWVDDFCVWIQTYGSDDVLTALAEGLKALPMSKNLIGWHLDELEAAVQGVEDRESDSDDESSGDSSDSSSS